MSQKQSIYELFVKHERLTASEAHRKYFKYSKTPLTSIRRAISDLKKEDKLSDTGKRKVGVYGSPEVIWELKTNLKLKLW